LNYSCIIVSLIAHHAAADANAQTKKVVIRSSPPPVPVNGQPNIFEYPILTDVELNCDVQPSLGSPFLVRSYRWNTEGCYKDTSGKPRCFPHGQTTQSVKGVHLTAEDAGNYTCTVMINNYEYQSNQVMIRIQGNNYNTILDSDKTMHFHFSLHLIYVLLYAKNWLKRFILF